MPTNLSIVDDDFTNILSTLRDDDKQRTFKGSLRKTPSTIRPLDISTNVRDQLEARKKSKEEAKRNDALLQSVKNDPLNADSYKILVEELADEIFSLKHQRDLQDELGKDSSVHQLKELQLLKHMLITIIKL